MMGHEKQNMRVRVDGYTRCCLTVIAVLLTILVVGLWADAVPDAPPVKAAEKKPPELPHPARKTQELLEEFRKSNVKLDELIRLFKTGQAKVQVDSTEGKKKSD